MKKCVVLTLLLAGTMLSTSGCGKKEDSAVLATVPQPAPIAAAQKTATSAETAGGGNIYETYCAACHAGGLDGAPRLGNKGEWAPRIAQGLAALEQAATQGKGKMPAKGGNTILSDEEVKAAVQYMVEQSR